MAKKRQFYLPPKQKAAKPGELKVSQEVKAELMKLAEEMVATKEDENIKNFITLALVTLRRSERFGPVRLNRFLVELTAVSDEAVGAEDTEAWYKEQRDALTAVGCVAFLEGGAPSED